MSTLMLISAISFFLSLLLLVAVRITQRKHFAYACHGFFILSFLLTSVMSIQKRDYAFAILFAAFTIVWFYKLSTGKIVSTTLH